MSWKKNGFSYFLWFVYTIAVSAGILGFFGISTGLLQAWKGYGVLLIGVAYLIVGFLVLGLHKLMSPKISTTDDTGIIPIIVESVIVVALFAAGIILRATLMPHLTGNGADMVYMEAAKVAEGNVIPQVVHGATYIYLELLHAVFLFFGNRLVAAVWMQVVLVCLASVFLYFAVRELAGKVPAIIMLVFVMLSPFMLLKTMELSPEIPFFLVYSLALWLIAEQLKKSSANPVVYVLVGLLIGVCCYLDLTGITLLVFAAGVFTVEREQPVRAWNKRVVSFLLNLLGTAIGWCAIISVDALLCGKSVPAVMSAWLQLYQPGAFSFALEHLKSYKELVPNGMFLYAFLVFGIFSFWCRKKQERQGVWTGAILILILLHCFQMVTPELSGSIFVYIFFTVLAGVSVADIFVVNPAGTIQTDLNAVEVDRAENMEEQVVTELQTVEREATPITEPAKVQFLENPLPLPKKRQASVMDYPITEMAEYDFDIEVADDDDFDI